MACHMMKSVYRHLPVFVGIPPPTLAGLQTVKVNYDLQMPPSLGSSSHEYCAVQKLDLEMLTNGLQHLLMIFNLKNI